MKRRNWVILLIVVLVIAINFPINHITYIKNKEGKIVLSRIDRSTVIFDLGVFFTPGVYVNKFLIPEIYFNPSFIGDALDIGCFEFYFEYKEDTIKLYPGGYHKFKNTDSKFQVIELNNVYRGLTWDKIKENDKGRYIYIDCNR